MRIKRAAALCALALVLAPLVPVSERVSPKAAAASAGEAKAECVVEVSSKRILHECNAETDLPMASTTKILTAILVIDDCALDETFAIPKEAEGVEGSSVYLKAGEIYTVHELLYGLMLRSGNDCAVALALHHSGSIEAFAQKMNEKAVRLGATHSHFVNPHGLPDKRHYTTARDLAFVAAYAMENETFREIVSCKFYEPRGWANKNKMLRTYEGAIGVKTGFTTSAGRCLVTSAERGGMKLVSVVLDCPQMYERTADLLNAAFSAYSMHTLCAPSEKIEGFAVRYGFSYPLTEEEAENVTREVELYFPRPEHAGEVAGEMKIYLKKELLFSQNLFMI